MAALEADGLQLGPLPCDTVSSHFGILSEKSRFKI